MTDHTEECSFCKNKFTTKSVLLKHQKTAKYCLQKQGKTNACFECLFCKKKFTQKIDLQRHELSCVDKRVVQTTTEKDNIIAANAQLIHELKEQVSKLQDQLVEIASKSVSRPVTVNQNNNKVQQINNLYAITPTHFEEQSENLTLEHIKEGVAGYVRFALEFMLKNRILCTDVSRKIVKYKNADDVVVTDAEMTMLAEKIFSAIKVRNETIIDTYLRELNEKLWDANHDGLTEKQIEELERGLDVVRNMVMRLVSQRRESKEITMGKKPQLHRNFVKGICERSTQASE